MKGRDISGLSLCLSEDFLRQALVVATDDPHVFPASVQSGMEVLVDLRKHLKQLHLLIRAENKAAVPWQYKDDILHLELRSRPETARGKWHKEEEGCESDGEGVPEDMGMEEELPTGYRGEGEPGKGGDDGRAGTGEVVKHIKEFIEGEDRGRRRASRLSPRRAAESSAHPATSSVHAAPTTAAPGPVPASDPVPGPNPTTGSALPSALCSDSVRRVRKNALSRPRSRRRTKRSGRQEGNIHSIHDNAILTNTDTKPVITDSLHDNSERSEHGKVDTDGHVTMATDYLPEGVNPGEKSVPIETSNDNTMENVARNEAESQSRDAPRDASRDRMADPKGRPRLSREHPIITCPGCGEEFHNHLDVTQHVMSAHAGQEGFPALVKEAEEARAASLPRGDIVLSCPVCGVTFPGQRVLRHIKLVHPSHSEFEILLKRTHQQFIQLRGQAHKVKRRLTSPKSKVTCVHCGKVIKSRSMTNHLNYHCKKVKNHRPMHSCSKCGFRSVCKKKYDEHIASTHGPDSAARFTCEDCGTSFRSGSGFLQHRQRHHGAMTSHGAPPTTHACKTCGKTFFSVTHLKRHQSVHSKDAPYKCTECDKSYRNQSTLVSHRRTVHQNQFRYTCTECGKGMTRQSQVKRHKCQGGDVAPQGTSSIEVTGLEGVPQGALLQIPELPLGMEGEEIYLVIEQDCVEEPVTVTI